MYFNKRSGYENIFFYMSIIDDILFVTLGCNSLFYDLFDF